MNSNLKAFLAIFSTFQLFRGSQTIPRGNRPVNFSDNIESGKDETRSNSISAVVSNPYLFAATSILTQSTHLVSRLRGDSCNSSLSAVKFSPDLRSLRLQTASFPSFLTESSSILRRNLFRSERQSLLATASLPPRRPSDRRRPFCAYSNLLEVVLEDRKEDAKRILEECSCKTEINAQDANGRNPLLIAVRKCGDNGWENIVIDMIEKGADLRHRLPDGKTTPLHLAVEMGSTRVVRAMLQRKDDLDLEAKNGDGYTPFLSAIKNGFAFGPLLELNGEDASLNEDARDIVKQLVNAGANIEADIDTARPLHLAAITADAFLTKVLLMEGANANAHYADDFTSTPLDLLLRGEGDEPNRMDCAIAYVNYGAELSSYRARDILRRFFPAAFKAAHAKAYDCSFDDYIVEKTAELTGGRETRLRETAVAYEDRAAFALYRLLEATMKKTRFAKSAPSELERRQLEIYEHVRTGGGGVIKDNERIRPSRWENLRLSYNLALASLNLNSDMEYVKEVALDLIVKPFPKIDDNFRYYLKWVKRNS